MATSAPVSPEMIRMATMTMIKTAPLVRSGIGMPFISQLILKQEQTYVEGKARGILQRETDANGKKLVPRRNAPL